eukprot:comp9259_c0_seq1/m.4382 comp9259_c0_seq1/g.4382  ORF comp9259_c0_seq1/g.4382 comp9259_c0_seq1/m.4382 type:complete len:508 (-) comp9259_c0_seq1:331-1854(-)
MASEGSCPFVGVRNTGPIHCTWKPNSTEKSPHTHAPYPAERPKILPNILYHVGNTPLVRVNKIAKEEGLQCELLAKCEFFNAGGSVKDRIAKRMFEEAEASGRIKPGDTIIEPTSGNTGLGLALCAAVKGYRCIICLPEKMSNEKVDTLKALGAEIVRTPNDAAFDSPESHIGVSYRLQAEIPNSHILNQYDNPYNPIAHYDSTAEELLDQCDGKIDMLVAGAGTGGTISGIARKLKERCPNIKIVGVDPVGSILAEPASLNTSGGLYQVEGIGYDFMPTSLDRAVIDQWYKSTDKPSFDMARRLIHDEGILCGGSSGTAMAAAVEAAKQLGPGQRCVVILPDGLRNYMSKFLRDDWMIEKGFMAPKAVPPPSVDKFGGATVADLKLASPVTVAPEVTCQEAAAIMEQRGFDYLPVTKDKRAVGLVGQGQMLSRLAHGKATPSDAVSKVMLQFDTKSKFYDIKLDTPLAGLEGFFEQHHIGFVTDSTGAIIHVITKIDLLSYLMRRK